MNACVKNRLNVIYQDLKNKSQFTCLKFRYKYNDVNVNIYFDAYDINSVSLSIVLAYENEYYLTPLNILEGERETEYLTKIPSKILGKILVSQHLDDFYENMEGHLLEDDYEINYYSKDKIFTNTLKYQKNDIDLPFWMTVKHIRMHDNTIDKLSARMDISRDILLKIQEKNLTLVRTGDPKKRKKLTLILGACGIKI